MREDTVVALSTPPGASGIAVIRLSGPDAVGIIDRLVPEGGGWETHRLYKKVLVDGSGDTLDEVLVVVMKAPNSYTGEDVVEISCHGGMQVVTDIMEEMLHLGARAAGPGEFTRRAFLGGRLDLVQAEAVADLISAETKLQRKVALGHLEGGLSGKVGDIESVLLDQLALVEVSIDFSEEEDIETYTPGGLSDMVSDLRGRIALLLESEVPGGKLRRGIRVTILGPRNSGKSSLYNALLGEERAIVSPIPGTTRDLLRERIHIGGFTYYLEDTAGIAETGCEIEAKGISIGRKAAEIADIVLFVVDGAEPLSAGTKTELGRLKSGAPLCVLNKIDLGLRITEDDAAAELGVAEVIAVSAMTGEGLDMLKKRIYDLTVTGDTASISKERIALNARQAAALRETDGALLRLEEAVAEEAPAEILSVEIRAAADACGRLTGRSVTDDLLEVIFGRFCIGK